MKQKKLQFEEERLLRELSEEVQKELHTTPGATNKILMFLWEQDLIGIKVKNTKSQYRSVNRFLAIRQWWAWLRLRDGQVNMTRNDLAAKYGISTNQIYKDLKTMLEKD